MLLFCEIIQKMNVQHTSKQSMSSILTTMIFDIYLSNLIKFGSKEKFDYYNTVLRNELLSDDIKKYFFEIFYLSQKNYWTLYRFKKNIKL